MTAGQTVIVQITKEQSPPRAKAGLRGEHSRAKSCTDAIFRQGLRLLEDRDADERNRLKLLIQSI